MADNEEMVHYSNPMDDATDDEDPKDAAAAPTPGAEAKVEDDKVLEDLVESELEHQAELMARRESGVPASAESPAAKYIVFGFLPVSGAVLLGLVIGNFIWTDWDVVNEYLFGWLAIVGLSTLSYMGCVYIIVMYFLHPEKSSERRQQMMFSSAAGLVHYSCILFETIDIFSLHPDGCIQGVTMLDQVSFLTQMAWQVAVAHGVFRYIQYESSAMDRQQEMIRHGICWGAPIFFALIMLLLDFVSLDEHGYDDNVWTGKTLSPWCAVSGSAKVRGAKALCIHGPHMIGAVMYGFFYFYIAQGNTKEQDLKDLMGDAEQNKQKAALKKSNINEGEEEYQGRNAERISASPHQVLLEASESKRVVDVSRAATTLRHCMVAFVMAYLLATLVIVYTEHFHNSHTDLGARFCYMVRIYLVAPQQLLYALFFAEGTLCGCLKGSAAEDEDMTSYDAPTATIKEGGVTIAAVNTKANAISLEAQVKAAKKGGDANLTIKSKKGGRLKKVLRKLLQALLFVPISFFAWMPIPFIYDNYTRKLHRGMIMAVSWVLIMMFPFVYFQGTRDNEDEELKTKAVIEVYLVFVTFAGLIGVYRIRNDPGLLVVYNPHDKVIWNTLINAFRNTVAYGALGIEFFQIPMLAFSAAQLGTRYGTQFKPKEYDMLGLDEWLIDKTIQWTFDDLFLIQYPLAVLGVICWILIYAVTNAFEMTFFRSINTVIPVDLTQVCLFGLAGPGFIFIAKNLMKPLFCVDTVGDCGAADVSATIVSGTTECVLDKYEWMYQENGTYYDTSVTKVLMAHRDIACWSERHMTYLSISLSALCVFMPTATLTKAQFYLPSENIRFVYYFQRIEVGIKGVMVYLALSYKTYSVLALILLILSSCVICLVVRVMQPSNFGHINRLKYMIHICSIYMCLTCLGAIAFDNRDRWLHAGIVACGWVAIWIGYTVLEKTVYRFEKQYLQQDVTPETIVRVEAEIKELQESVTTPLMVCGKRVSWGTHADILRLLQIARHDNSEIKKLAFESMSVLAYLDQLTKKSSFSAYTASTCMEIFCKAIDQDEDLELRAWAIRILKTFLQQERYVVELAELLDTDLKIAEPMAGIIAHGTQLTAQIDAGICLAEVCAIDSNQLKWVVPLLPILNEWILTGPLVAQHLALDMVSMLASRFDHAHMIVMNNCIPAIFELFSAIDETATSAADLQENPSSGFRKGFVQPSNISHVAHQLPRNVMRDFAAQFRNSRSLLAAMGEIVVNNPGAEEKEDETPAGITTEDFVAWMESGIPLNEAIKAKIIDGSIEGVDKQEPAEDEATETPTDNISQPQIEQLFSLVESKSTVQDESQVASFLSDLGLGERGEIEQVLKYSGLRPKGISEMSSSDEAILPARFAEWLRLGEKQDGIAKRTIEKCFAGAEEDTLTDEMIDELFQYMDEEGAGTVEISAIAAFLEHEGVGSKEDIYQLIKKEMVGRAVTDIMVQLSAKHISTMKNEMVRSVLSIVMECGAGMSGLARQKMIENNVFGIIKWALQGESPTALREVALQGLHALLGDCFSLDDVLADPEFKGYYADCLQLIEETKASVERNIAKRKAEKAAANKGKKSSKKKKANAASDEVGEAPDGPDTEKPVLVFEHLTEVQRRKVHLVAQFGNLDHASSGSPDNRIVEVKPEQNDKEFLKKHNGTPRKRLQSFGPVVADEPAKIAQPEPPKQEEVSKHTKKRRWKRGGKRKKRPEPPPVVVEAPGVDPWAEVHYDKNREMLAEAGVVELLCDVVADQNQEPRVIFYALDAVLLLTSHEAIPPPQMDRVYDACCKTLYHADIGVAVMAGFNLAAIIDQKPGLFAEPDTPMQKFRHAGRMIILQLRFIDGVGHAGLDAALQRSRTALR